MAALLSDLLLRETQKGRKHIDLDSKQSERKRCWSHFLWQLTTQTWTNWGLAKSKNWGLRVLLSSMVLKLLRENKETNKQKFTQGFYIVFLHKTRYLLGVCVIDPEALEFLGYFNCLRIHCSKIFGTANVLENYWAQVHYS